MDFNNLPFQQAIEFKQGDGSRQLAVFSDPDCPHCQRLESELAKLHDVTIHVFPFPLTQLHPNAADISRKIWCSPDRATAWRDYLTQQIEPKDAGGCDSPIEANMQLGQALGVNGTPTLMLSTNQLIPGAASAEDIAALLS